LISTNLETAITRKVVAKIIDPGEIMVPAAAFSVIINNLVSERLELRIEKQTLTIKTDNYEADLQGMSTDEFPIIPKIKKEKPLIQGNLPSLREALGRIVAAAQISELRPELSGILFTLDAGALKLTATDSFRLAERTILGSQIKLSGPAKFIVPLKTIQEVARLEDDETVDIYVDAKQAVFETKSSEIFSRLIDGQFPDYEPIIPKMLETELILNKDEFINALKLANPFSSRNNEVKIVFLRGEKAVRIHSADSLLGKSDYLLPAKTKGEAVEVTFNLRYLSDGLKSVSSTDLLFGLQGDSRPALIKSPTDSAGFYIIMPIKPA